MCEELLWGRAQLYSDQKQTFVKERGLKRRERKIRTTKKLFKTCFRCFRRKEKIIIRICAILGSVCVYHTPDITIYIYRYDIIMTVHFIR